jgi:hypothetical protein
MTLDLLKAVENLTIECRSGVGELVMETGCGEG